MEYPKRVRLGQPQDEDEVMQLCRDLWAENGIFSLNETKVRATLQNAFVKRGGILGVVGSPGKIEGLIYMVISTFWYSDDPHLEELFLYVKPEYRKTKDAIDLMRFAKWCTQMTGFKLVIGVLSTERTKGKVRLYERQFDNPAGNFFIYDAPSTAVAAQH